jgi:hypothetical protein
MNTPTHAAAMGLLRLLGDGVDVRLNDGGVLLRGQGVFPQALADAAKPHTDAIKEMLLLRADKSHVMMAPICRRAT